jgi:hypothetical protein
MRTANLDPSAIIVEDNGNIADACGNIDHSGVNKCGDGAPAMSGLNLLVAKARETSKITEVRRRPQLRHLRWCPRWTSVNGLTAGFFSGCFRILEDAFRSLVTCT